MAQFVKEEIPLIKEENVQIEDILIKHEQRKAFNIFKNEGVEITSKMTNMIDTNTPSTAEEFKKFLLACIWEKRIPKHEILMMNLVQNIATLNQAVKDETIPLKQALKILIGL